MDLEDCIKSCTKINKKQGVKNVKWSSVPKDENRTLQHWNKPLPYYLELQKDLHDHSSKHHFKGKKNQNKHEEKDEEFQVIEIRQSIREAGIGWNVVNGLEKRYKESQQKYAKANTEESISSESNASFTTAQTTSTFVADDSFLSAVHDFQYLQISDDKKDEITISEVLETRNQDKQRYKRNALITGIIQNAGNNFPVNENALTNYFTNENQSNLLNSIRYEKENLNIVENKQSTCKNGKRKSFQSKKNVKPLKDSNQNNSNQQNYLVQKKVEVTRKYYMDIPDECFSEFVTSKSMKKSRKMKICQA